LFEDKLSYYIDKLT
jgi:hypothetical protein